MVVPERKKITMEKIRNLHPFVWLLVAIFVSVVVLFVRYGTVERCEMLRQEVKQRFPGEVSAAVRQSPGGMLVVGLVEGGAGKLLTFDLTPNQCLAKLSKLWLAEDEEIGAVLME